MRNSLTAAWLASIFAFTGYAFAADNPVTDEASVIADFKKFSEGEADRIKSHFDLLVGKFLTDTRGTPMPLSLPRKYLFSGITLEAAPSDFSFDVVRTNSLITPYVGYIEWPIVLLRATTHAKGRAKYCKNQELKVCLENGGKIVETDILYKSSATRVPTSLKYEYAYQNGSWKPKKEFRKVLEELLVSMEISEPLSPSIAPSILGAPTD